MSYLGIGNLFGDRNVTPPSYTEVNSDYRGLVQGFAGGQEDSFNAEQQWKPKYIEEIIKNLTNYGGKAVSAFRGVDPAQQRLSDSMTRTATEGLDAGSRLDPSTLKMINQYTRTGQAARGLGYSPADVYQETGDAARLGLQMQQQRQDFAGRVSGANAQTNAMAVGALQGAGPTMIRPEDNYDIYNTAYNARAASGIATNNTQAAQESFDL